VRSDPVIVGSLPPFVARISDEFHGPARMNVPASEHFSQPCEIREGLAQMQKEIRVIRKRVESVLRWVTKEEKKNGDQQSATKRPLLTDHCLLITVY
jgi:hypothetical protein